MHPQVARAQYLSLISPVQLGVTDQVAGTVFRKQIMSFGRWVNPNWWYDEELWMELDTTVADEMIANFDAGTYGKRISVPLNHTGDVTANAGQVIKLEKGADGLWAYLDIRRPQTVEDINNGLIFDVSMGFDFDYVDQKDGLHHGATLIHVALVTDPYLNNMDDFKQTDTAALSKGFDEFSQNLGFSADSKSVIMMSKSNVQELRDMTKKKLAKVSNDKDFPIEVVYTDAEGAEQKATIEAGAELEVPAEAEQGVKDQVGAAVKTPEADATDTAADPDADKTDPEDVTPPADPAAAADQGADQSLSKDERKELAKLRGERAAFAAEQEYAKLLSAGKITPAQKDLFLSAASHGSFALSADVKTADGKVLLSKGDNTSITTLLSAILSAGAGIKVGEQGADAAEGHVELSEQDRKQLTRLGVNPETYMKQVADGKIKVTEN